MEILYITFSADFSCLLFLQEFMYKTLWKVCILLMFSLVFECFFQIADFSLVTHTKLIKLSYPRNLFVVELIGDATYLRYL